MNNKHPQNKLETRNSKLETRNSKLETRNSKLEQNFKIKTALIFLTAIFLSNLMSCNHNNPIENKEKFTVSFNANGGKFADGKTTKDFKVEIGKTIAKLASTPTKKNHTFVAWYEKQDGSGNSYNFSKAITKDLTLYAKWTSSKKTVKKFTVSFNANGGKFAGGKLTKDFNVESGKAIAKPASNPTKKNYTFVAWFTEKIGGKQWNFSTKITEKTILYAHWKNSLLPQPKTDADFVQITKENLTIETNKVVKNIYLQNQYWKDVSIEWKSGDTDIIKIVERSNTNGTINTEGEVSRPDETTTVKLTAIIKKGKAKAEKEFMVTVYGKNNEAVDLAYNNTSVTPLLVQGSTNQITLIEGNDVETEWTSKNEAIIKPNGTKIITVTRPTNKTDVSLTATIKKGAIKKEKTFTITVYPTGTNANDKELLERIILEKEVASYFDLPEKIDGSNKSIEWESSNPKIIEVSNDTGFNFKEKFAKIKPLIYQNQEVTLTAKIGLEKKEFLIIVKGIGEYAPFNKTMSFDATTIKTGFKQYTYTHNKEERILTTECTHQLSFSGNLVDIETELNENPFSNGEFDKIYIKGYKELSEMTNITLQDIKEKLLKPSIELYHTIPEEGQTIIMPETPEEIFNSMIKWCIPMDISYSEFEGLSSDAEKTNRIKMSIKERKQYWCNLFQVDTTTTWDYLADNIENLSETRRKALLELETRPVRYKYSFDASQDGYIHLNLISLYDQGVRYCKQRGTYTYSKNNKSLKIECRATNQCKITISEGSGSTSSSKEYFGFLINEYSEFIGKRKNDDEKITANIQDNNDGTINLIIGADTYKLKFVGSNLD